MNCGFRLRGYGLRVNPPKNEYSDPNLNISFAYTQANRAIAEDAVRGPQATIPESGRGCLCGMRG